jgi:hypothetical protein
VVDFTGIRFDAVGLTFFEGWSVWSTTVELVRLRLPEGAAPTQAIINYKDMRYEI